MHSMADAADLPELLDIEMQETARGGPFIPVRWAGWIEAVQAMEPQASLFLHDRRDGQVELARDPQRTAPRAPSSFNAPALRRGSRVGEWAGRLERSCSPASPSVSARRIHFRTVCREKLNFSARCD